MAQKSRTHPSTRHAAVARHLGQCGRVVPSPRPTVISLVASRRRRSAPTIQLGRHTYRVVNPRLWTLARWVARSGWRAWIYEGEA